MSADAKLSQTCQNCNHWKPKYHNVGVCTAEGMPNAKFWVVEAKELLTVGSFGCQAFTDKEPIERSVI